MRGLHTKDSFDSHWKQHVQCQFSSERPANSTLSLGGVNTFRANRAHVSGGAIWLDHSNLTLSGFNHFVGCVASYEGGAIYSYAATASLTGNNTFECNTATTGGGYMHAGVM